MTTPKRTHALEKAPWCRGSLAKCQFYGCDICALNWLTRRLKRYARNHGRRDHVMYLMGALNEAMNGKEKRK